MSLILEALKRSENERLTKSNKAGELVTSSFGDADTSEKRSWLPQFLAIALAVNAVLLGSLYLSSKNSTDETEQVALVEGQATQVDEIEEPSTQTIPAVSQSTVQEKTNQRRTVKAATPLAEELVKNTPTRDSQENNSSWEASAVAENAAPAIPTDFAMIETQETASAATQSEPVSLRELTNDGLAEQLENYEVNTHIYNEEDPARSFVLLNMEKYRVGDTLNNTDYEIADITVDGVVIDHGTGQVLISAN